MSGDAFGLEGFRPIFENVWVPASVEEEPEMRLSDWQIILVSSSLWEGKTPHFVGRNMAERTGRVSSKIVSFDKDTMRGVTESGRVYGLIGHPGSDGNARYTLSVWNRMNKVNYWEDITKDYWDKTNEQTS